MIGGIRLGNGSERQPAMAHVHSHSTGDGSEADQRRVLAAMLLTAGFLAVEVAGAVLSGSLALLADAGHMLTDTAALALAWFAFRIARRRPDLRRSYGYHRVQVLAAFVNGMALVVIVAGIAVEAVTRLVHPVAVLGGPMLAVAVLGLAVNIAAFAVLHGGDRRNLNLRGATLHVLGDLLASLATIAAAVVIVATGWTPIDPLLSLAVALLIATSAWRLIRQSGHILLEGTPEAIDPEAVRDRISLAVPAIRDVHHLHIWSLTDARPVVTLHAVVDADADPDATLDEIHRSLEALFGIGHATVQLERIACADRGPGGPRVQASADSAAGNSAKPSTTASAPSSAAATDV
jgi:cobalt-zinc-cadmium efflux system protein